MNLSELCISQAEKILLTMASSSEIIPQEKYAEKIIDILKALVHSAICWGFSKTSFLVRDHVKYIKKIQSANDPELHIRYTAKKLFPNEEEYYEKVQKVHTRYEGDILNHFDELYALYYKLSKGTIQRRKRTPIEADSILADLLI